MKNVFETILVKLITMADHFTDYVNSAVHPEKFWALANACDVPADSSRVANWPEWLRNGSFYQRLYFFLFLYKLTIDENFDYKRLNLTKYNVENVAAQIIFDWPANATTLGDIKAMAKWERSLHMVYSPVLKYFNSHHYHI